jgi:hypothetical protein
MKFSKKNLVNKIWEFPLGYNNEFMGSVEVINHLKIVLLLLSLLHLYDLQLCILQE